MKYLVAGIFVAAFIAFIFAYSIFSWGYVCYKFWGWFLIPVFPSLPAITFMQAIGLMFFINLFKNQTSSSSNEEKDEDKKYGTLIGSILAPWILLLLAGLFV